MKDGGGVGDGEGYVLGGEQMLSQDAVVVGRCLVFVLLWAD